MRALCFLSAFHVELGAAELQNPDGTLPPSPPSGKTGGQWPLHFVPEAFADFLVYLQQPAAPIPLLQNGNTCISLPYYFAPTLLSV